MGVGDYSSRKSVNILPKHQAIHEASQGHSIDRKKYFINTRESGNYPNSKIRREKSGYSQFSGPMNMPLGIMYKKRNPESSHSTTKAIRSPIRINSNLEKSFDSNQVNYTSIDAEKSRVISDSDVQGSNSNGNCSQFKKIRLDAHRDSTIPHAPALPIQKPKCRDKERESYVRPFRFCRIESSQNPRQGSLHDEHTY